MRKDRKDGILGWAMLSMVFASALLMAGCISENKRTDLDSANHGTIHISVDESFKPVIQSQIQVYEALHPGAKIIAEYKPEAACMNDFTTDSTRMVIVTRKLTDQEEKFYKDKYYFYPTMSKIAYDALAVIVNKDADDSSFYMASLRSILDGSAGGTKKVVFDGASGSSAVRFVKDSLLKGRPLDTTRVFAVNGSKAVIKMVEERTDVIGFVGVSWVGNPEDTTQLSFLNKIRIASLSCSNCTTNEFVRPYQGNILRKIYPMVRSVFYILKENYVGLGTAFANFLDSERGQLIFKRDYLGPAKLNFYIRTVQTDE